MLIPIITIDKQPDSVPAELLDQMILGNEIYAFERSTGWVVIGRDPVRSQDDPFDGPERRRAYRVH